MGRWGWRQIATLVVSVWIMAACKTLPPAPALDSPEAPQATLNLRTAARTVSPPPTAAGTATAPQQRQEPTRTPRPSATPHYYTVESGDTLETIAARFGISPAALQAANQSLPPDMILPGNVLLIPDILPEISGSSGSATGTLARILPSNTPLPVLVDLPNCLLTPADELICLGWVTNPLAEAVANLSVAVYLYDSQGGNSQGRAALAQQIVPAGGGAPYAVRFPAAPDYIAAETQVLSAESPAAVGASALTVVESQHILGSDLVTVQSMLRHDGPDTLANLLVIATLFDAEDHVVGFRALRQEAALPPGGTVEVEVWITPLQRGTTRHVLYAEGQPAAP